MIRSRSVGVLAATVFVIATACARQSPSSGGASPSPSRLPSPSLTPSPDAAVEWLVVLGVAPDPAGVRDDAASLAQELGGAIQVAPGSCFTGLPARFGGDRYILGALGGSKAQVDALAVDTHIEPLFEGEVQVVCVD